MLLLGSITSSFAADKSLCEESLTRQKSAAVYRPGASLEETEGSYRYPDYRGPENAILEAVKKQGSKQSPVLTNVVAHGRVFSWEELLRALDVNFDGRSKVFERVLQDHVNYSDPLWNVTTRMTYTNGEIIDWIFAQYPELAEPVRRWWSDAGPDHRVIGKRPSEAVANQWLTDHPAYRNGILIFPRPSLWNKTTPISANARAASREFFIETIGALFSLELAQERFTDLKGLLLHLSGANREQHTQEKAVTLMVRWVLAQYPELIEVFAGAAKGLSTERMSKDALIEKYGRTLGIVPISWTLGDYRDVCAQESLPSLPNEWRSNVLGPLLRMLRGEVNAPEQRPSFELKDPDTGKRRELRAGDTVDLIFKPRGLDPEKQRSYREFYNLTGTVQRLVRKRNGEIVGIQMQTQHDGEPVSKVYWIADFDVEGSFILRSDESEEAPVILESMRFPENSGEFMVVVGSSDLQAPLSIGDFFRVRLLTPLEKKLHDGSYIQTAFAQIIVTAFPRGEGGDITGVTGYVDVGVEFDYAKRINRFEDGTPVSIVTSNGSTLALRGNFPEITVPWSQLSRVPEAGTKFMIPSSSAGHGYPQSWVRDHYDRSLRWGRSKSSTVAVNEDSDDYMLPIGREPLFGRKTRHEKAPIAVGDEVLLCVKERGRILDFKFERVLVIGFERQGAKIVGIRGLGFQSVDENKLWLFADIEKEGSYIEVAPWFGAAANTFPGAYQKRVSYTPKAKSRDSTGDLFEDLFDIFGYRPSESVSVPAWTEKPISYDAWLEKYEISKGWGSKKDWAFWVMQSIDGDSKESLTKKYRALARRFHPDLNPDQADANTPNSAITIVNSAWAILQQALD